MYSNPTDTEQYRKWLAKQKNNLDKMKAELLELKQEEVK